MTDEPVKTGRGGGTGIGRRPKWREEMVVEAHNLCLLGYNNEQIARVFEVEPRIFEKWIHDRKDLKAALYNGRDVAVGRVAAALTMRAEGFTMVSEKIVSTPAGIVRVPTTIYYPPSETAASLVLRNRAATNWRDRTEQAVTVTGSQNVNITTVDPIEASRDYQGIMDEK